MKKSANNDSYLYQKIFKMRRIKNVIIILLTIVTELIFRFLKKESMSTHYYGVKLPIVYVVITVVISIIYEIIENRFRKNNNMLKSFTVRMDMVELLAIYLLVELTSK